MGSKNRCEETFNLEVEELTRQPGKTVAGVAQEKGIPWKTVTGWVNQYDQRGSASFMEVSGGYVRAAGEVDCAGAGFLLP